jgi:hypothetical protein
MLKTDQIQVELPCLDPTLAQRNMKETYDCVICCLALFKNIVQGSLASVFVAGYFHMTVTYVLPFSLNRMVMRNGKIENYQFLVIVASVYLVYFANGSLGSLSPCIV